MRVSPSGPSESIRGDPVRIRGAGGSEVARTFGTFVTNLVFVIVTLTLRLRLVEPNKIFIENEADLDYTSPKLSYIAPVVTKESRYFSDVFVESVCGWTKKRSTGFGIVSSISAEAVC